ncbi:MAG TPA: hypothetical protein VF310_10740 [Vicinamibacteria bacterium]
MSLAAALVALALVPPHWDTHVPGGAARQARVLVVADTTGDARVQAALRDFRTRWNLMIAGPELRGAHLPRVRVIRAAAAPPSADVIVVRDDSLATAGVGGPYRVDGDGHTRLGIVKLRRATFTWSRCNLRTAVAHEMGHVMGLAHNEAEDPGGAPSVMRPGNGPYHLGCPTWFNAGDRQALQALYDRAD